MSSNTRIASWSSANARGLSYTAGSRSIAIVFTPRLPSRAVQTDPVGPRPTTATSKLSFTFRSMPFKPPPLACDAHCHVFGPAAKFPYDPKAAYIPADAPFEALQKMHARLGLERAVIVHASCHGPDMRATLDAIARSGGRYRGTAIIDESCTDQDFQRMHDGGIRGVRFNFVKHLGGRPEMGFFKRTVQRVEAMQWHLILHLDAADLVELADLFRTLPVPFVIDHMGRVRAGDGLEQAPFRVLLETMKNPRAWVKICGAERVSSKGPPFSDAVPFGRALVDIAPERILWGTDWPHPNVK